MSKMPQPQSIQGSRQVLPPISPSPDVYKQFLKELEDQINVEVARVECAEEGPDPHRYAIYKGAFDQIIDNVSAYKSLLSAIKAEYEDCIDTIEKGQEEAFYLSGKVKALASEQTTLSLYQKRADELDQKLGLVKADNEVQKLNLKRLQRFTERGKSEDCLWMHWPYYKEKLGLSFGPAEAVSFALARSGSMMSVRRQHPPLKMMTPPKEEAELLLEYIEQFNEMFERGSLCRELLCIATKQS
nr:clathrin heavy chain linker domain-containing protein 1-like [Lytechinus pictus]